MSTEDFLISRYTVFANAMLLYYVAMLTLYYSINISKSLLYVLLL